MLKYNKNISIFIVIITSLHPNNHLISSPVIKFLFIFHLLHGHECKKCDEFNGNSGCEIRDFSSRSVLVNLTG